MAKIVSIGGGSGRFTLLQGLKDYSHEITAIVSMTDSGGSTRKLRDEYGLLPAGDITRTIVALSDSPEIMRKLIEHRFNNGKGTGSLDGHKFGNIMLAGLKEITGNFEEAVAELSRILAINGKVVPVTLDKADIKAELENGAIIFGENNIDVPVHDGTLRIARLSAVPAFLRPTDSAIKAIREADQIVFGPGDLFTSILPNLLVDGISEEIRKSKAEKVYFCNLMTKWGETVNFSASDYVRELEKYLNGKLDRIIVNTGAPDERLLLIYAKEKSIPVKLDLSDDFRVISLDLVADSETLIRHDSEKSAAVIDRISKSNSLSLAGVL